MSLDVYLETGKDREEDCPHCDGTGKICTGRERLFRANITHNLNTMADAAGIYKACWHPEEINITKAGQLIPLLKEGLEKLRAEPERFKKLNPSNGWGSYDGLRAFVSTYLTACEAYPEADIAISR